MFARLTRSVVEPAGGRVVELRGDETLAVFASARRALRAAVELQGCFERERREDLPLHIGIGVDAGEAVAVEGGYRGAALNLAALPQDLRLRQSDCTHRGKPRRSLLDFAPSHLDTVNASHRSVRPRADPALARSAVPSLDRDGPAAPLRTHQFQGELLASPPRMPSGRRRATALRRVEMTAARRSPPELCAFARLLPFGPSRRMGCRTVQPHLAMPVDRPG
jgi:hypothetical protein